MLELDIIFMWSFCFCSVQMFFPEHSKIENYRQRAGSVTNHITHGLDGSMVSSHGFCSFPEKLILAKFGVADVAVCLVFLFVFFKMNITTSN